MRYFIIFFASLLLPLMAAALLLSASCAPNSVTYTVGMGNQVHSYAGNGGRSTVGTQGFASCGNNPATPLPSFDFGNAGYKGGAPIPNKTAAKTYGEGRFTINEQIVLRSGDVLRGAGKGKTTLFFPGGLKQMGFLCRNGEKITVTGGGTGDCFDWTSRLQYMGVIGAGGLESAVAEVGIEDLTIEFPPDHAWTHYANYNGTSGYNGIDFNNCTNCWAKNVAVRNTDNGIFVSNGSRNVTLTGIDVTSRPGGGHIHIAFVGTDTAAILATNFRVYGNSSHGLTNNWGVTNTVFANGWSENVRLESDHACGADQPCVENVLYSNISGKLSSIQKTVFRRPNVGKHVDGVWWNVGSVDRCPLDVYTAQKNY